MARPTGLPYPRAPLYFTLLLLIAAYGFYPSYFSRLQAMDFAHHVHGIAASAWMILLIVQGWFARQRQIRIHRALGKIVIVVASLFVTSGVLMIIVMLRNTDPFSKTFGIRLAVVDASTVTYFAVAVGLAVRHRGDVQLHARFMTSTALMVLPPALARSLQGLVAGATSFHAAFNGSYFVAECVVGILLLDDAHTGRIRAPYLVLLGLLLCQHALFVYIGGRDGITSLAVAQ